MNSTKFVIAAISAGLLCLFATKSFAQVGAPLPNQGALTIVADENTGVVTVNGIVSTPDATGTYLTGGIFVLAGDINYIEGVGPARGQISDVIRIIPSIPSNFGPAGDQFRVFSDLEPGELNPGPFDIGVPAPNPTLPTGQVLEPNVYGPVLIPGFPNDVGNYTFVSDVDVPEPASISLLAIGGLSLLARRRT